MKRFAFLALVAVSGVASAQQIVLSNSPAGDLIVGPSLPTPITDGPGWNYVNVRAGGTIGISTAFPRSGDGSVHMTTATEFGKADIEFYGVLGTLGDLTEVGYDWYRSSTSLTTPLLAPSMRLLMDADGNMETTGDRGYLIYEPYYTRGNVAGWAAETDGWITENATAGNFWQRNFSNFTTITEYGVTLNDWKNGAAFPNALTFSGNSSIFGLSLGVGSGWPGTFDGAIDNVRIGFGGTTKNVNFETVPEPASMAVLGLGLAALKRRRKNG